MNSITTQSKSKSILLKTLKFFAITAFWILVWEAASRYVSRDNELMLALLPGPKTVFETFLDMCRQKTFYIAVAKSLSLIFKGFFKGIILGFVFGIATNYSKIAEALFAPIFKIIRAVPVVAFIILLYLFLETDSVPETIVILMVLPVMWQATHDGLHNPDKSLLEMSKVFKLSKIKTFIFINLPGIIPQLVSTAITSLGLAWKSGIAAEVICETKDTLGFMLKNGSEWFNYESVYAITLTVIFLSIIIEIFLKKVFEIIMKGRGTVK